MFDLTPTTRNAWLMEPAALDAMQRTALAVARARGWPSPVQLDEARKAAAQKLRKVSGKVAVLPVQGVVENRMSGWGYLFGSFSCEAATRALDSLVANNEVAAVVLDVDSPGGTCQGVEEFADAVYAARGAKPIYAVANAMACSAAYWIASSAGNFYCTPSGTVGSVGAYSCHVDISAALEEEGVKVTLVNAGQYKAEGHMARPLSPEAKEYMQTLVDAVYDRFCAAVARNRGVGVEQVRKSYGQGRIVDARPALKAGMIDGLMTLGDVLSRLTGNASASMPRRGGNAEVLKLREEQARRRRVDAGV